GWHRLPWDGGVGSGVLGRSPGSPALGWDTGRVRYYRTAVSRQRRGGGSGERKRAHPKLSQVNGLGAEAPSQDPPDPRRSAAEAEGAIVGRPAPTVSPA